MREKGLGYTPPPPSVFLLRKPLLKSETHNYVSDSLVKCNVKIQLLSL